MATAPPNKPPRTAEPNKPRRTAEPNKPPGTAERILDSAERLVQDRGFNSFSYADVANELGITKASLHYHFPGKAELGQALIQRYAERFAAALDQIDRDLPDARAKLEAYAGLYAEVLRGRRMCMCGILAAEYQTLPEDMRTAVIRFFDDNHEWLVGVLSQGQADHTLNITGSIDETAQSILGTLEGAMLVARPYGDTSRFDATTHQLIGSLTSTAT
ncbi:MAG: TetR/AcrR family transcriptional regulator [Solirubrobacteraceae bacterium]